MYNPLIVLRLALPGEPSLRDFAAEISVSYEMLNKFENATVMLGADNLAAYCKATRTAETEVMRRYHRVRLTRLDQERRDSKKQLQALGVKGRRSGRPQKTAAK